MKSIRTPRKAFTITELLVAIGIIAVLLVILIPTLSQVRNRAHVPKSLQNLRTIHTYAMLYTQDNNGMLPYSGYAGGQGNWYLALRDAGFDGPEQFPFPIPTNDPDGIRICPLADRTRDIRPTSSYSLNFHATVGLNHSSPRDRRFLASIDQPSRTVLISIGRFSGGSLRLNFGRGSGLVNAPEAVYPIRRLPPGVAGNISNPPPEAAFPAIFVDGRAEMVLLSDVPEDRFDPFWGRQQ